MGSKTAAESSSGYVGTVGKTGQLVHPSLR